MKCRDLLDITFGKKEPFFKISAEEWKAVRASSALNEVKDKLERKFKILNMIYKNAYLNLKHLIPEEPFFKEELPDHFEDVKMYHLFYIAHTEELCHRCLKLEEKIYQKQKAIEG